ncbi:N-acetyltransferase [Synechococcus sp. PCC 7336]|uniref:GNAT family N-acetyltransferase n=1 Tax=Synechococcus sp. PCC 7336 TaxID=195250 RepID=UPI0003471C63|nr:GNAT family N-acetyltransferase [Synechococcus sp. PCC 7336]
MPSQHRDSLATGDRLETSQEGRSLPIATALLQQSSQLGDREIGFRAIACPDDEPFLARVYASTRAEEMAMVDWNDEQKADFLQMQFHAQHSHYQEHYADAEFLIICAGDRPIGRLYIARWEDEFRIIDIALLSAERNRGVGSAILTTILSQARQEGLAVRIHVEQFNPAMRLYRRLGFDRIGDAGVYYLMEWLPSIHVSHFN